MDNPRNVIAAIAMSACVIVLWSLYFSPSTEEVKKLKSSTRRKTINSGDGKSQDRTRRKIRKYLKRRVYLAIR